MSQDTWYFAYGSNLDTVRKEMRTGTIRECHAAKLAGYRLAFNKRGSNGDVYANLIASPTEEVLGVVYYCSEQAIQELDRCEGVASGHYRRCSVEVETLDGRRRLNADVYIAEPEFACEETTPSEQYLSHILRGARTHQLPTSYLRMIRIRAGRESCGEGKRLWRSHIVDDGLHDSWLGALNALLVFDLISICEGHMTELRNNPRSLPHVNLRIKPNLLSSATRCIIEGPTADLPLPESKYLTSQSRWTMEFSRRLAPRRGQQSPMYKDDIVVRIVSTSAFDSQFGQSIVIDWFGHIVPELQKYDSDLFETLSSDGSLHPAPG